MECSGQVCLSCAIQTKMRPGLFVGVDAACPLRDGLEAAFQPAPIQVVNMRSVRLDSILIEIEAAFESDAIPSFCPELLDCAHEWGGTAPWLVSGSDEYHAIESIEGKHWRDFQPNQLHASTLSNLPVSAIAYYLRSFLIVPWRGVEQGFDPLDLALVDNVTILNPHYSVERSPSFYPGRVVSGATIRYAKFVSLCERLSFRQLMSLLAYIHYFEFCSPFAEVREACEFSLFHFWGPLVFSSR